VPGGTRVIVLSKPPRHGACKARLAETLGAGPAARLARAFLADTWATVSAWVSGQPELELVLAQSGPPDEYPLLLPLPATVRQAEGDLGRRMATLVAGALGQRSRVLLLGSDSPGLPETHLAAAVAALDGADLVLGPHRDGGFWCLGVRGGPPALWGNTWLDDLDWETDATLRQVEARAQRIGLVVARAPEWFDVDRERDLPRLREALGADPERAP
jgi:rSAM/selenodomain-associated transferase 1